MKKMKTIFFKSIQNENVSFVTTQRSRSMYWNTIILRRIIREYVLCATKMKTPNAVRLFPLQSAASFQLP